MATQALATRETTGIAHRQPTEYDRLRHGLERRANDFAMALPSHIAPEKFQRTIMTAVQKNPDLLQADRASLITACMMAAQDGLLPDGREAALVIYKTRKKVDGQWVTVAVVNYLSMAYGLRKKILQSGEVSKLSTGVVYRREYEEGHFVYEEGTEAMLRHKPMLDLPDEDAGDDQIIAAYSLAEMKDGTKSFKVLSRAKINKVRQMSQTGAVGRVYQYGPNKGKPIEPIGPWVDWFEEQAQKTALRNHSKTLPMSGDLIDVEVRNETLASRSSVALLGSAEGAKPTALPSREDFDPETGEVASDDAENHEDEETARDLDRQSFAEMEGRSDDQYGDQHDGTDIIDEDEAKADALIERIVGAGILGDVIAVENELGKIDLAPDQAKRVRDAAGKARKRFGK